MAKGGKFRTIMKRGSKKVYALRNADGTFFDIQSIKKAMQRDVGRKAKTKVRSGKGFKGDTV